MTITNETNRIADGDRVRTHQAAAPVPFVDFDEPMLERFRAAAAIDDRDNTFFDSTHAELAGAGYYTANLPSAVGGGGLNMLEMGRRQRRLATYAPAPALATCMHLYWTGAAADFHRLGESSLDHVIDGALDGEIYSSGHAETGNDVPVVLSTTDAEPVDGGYRITGRKLFSSLGPIWTRNGFHSMDSSDPDAPMIIHGFLHRDDPGVTIVENWDTIAMRSSQSHDVVLDSVFVPDERVASVVPAGSGEDPVTGTAFLWALALVCNVYVGIAERALELAIASLHAKTSIGLGGRTLATSPMLQYQVADMWIALDGVRSSLDMIATDWGDGVAHDPEWELRIVGAKQRTSDMVRFVVDTAMDVAGGSSIRNDNEMSRLLRDSRAAAYHAPAAAIAHTGIGAALLSTEPAGPSR
ncbi:MAG: acyl-CoA dehydrogenase family protein [Ilumatobacter sp.]|uniref:acyl-CoA dehydrogenase family protein n=1 Tax=Ilumatobacter sp. TaxID=1967498 RepID=UPI003C75EF60